MRVTIDLMKKSTQIIDLSNVINPRVGDDDLLLPLHIGYGDNLFDMRGKDVEFLSNDPNKKNIYIAGTCNTNTPGDNLYMGDLTFRFPAGTFQADGTYDPDKTMFRIVDKETQKVISSVNVKITVMKNAIEFDFDPDNSSYDSRLETMLHDFHDKGQTMLDEIKDLKNQTNSNVSGDTAATANAAKKQADQNAGDISDLKGEVAGARGRFANMAGREDAQDAAINQKESIVNANANYAALRQKDAQQDLQLAQKAGRYELEDKLAQMNLQPEMYADLNAVNAAYPNGATKLIVTDDGHRAVYRNGQWIDGGIYQAAGVDPDIKNALANTDHDNLLPNPTFKSLDGWSITTTNPSIKPNYFITKNGFKNSNVLTVNGYGSVTDENSWTNVVSDLVAVEGGRLVTFGAMYNSKNQMINDQQPNINIELDVLDSGEKILSKSYIYSAPDVDDNLHFRTKTVKLPNTASYVKVKFQTYGPGSFKMAYPQVNYGLRFAPNSVGQLQKSIQSDNLLFDNPVSDWQMVWYTGSKIYLDDIGAVKVIADRKNTSSLQSKLFRQRPGDNLSIKLEIQAEDDVQLQVFEYNDDLKVLNEQIFFVEKNNKLSDQFFENINLGNATTIVQIALSGAPNRSFTISKVIAKNGTNFSEKYENSIKALVNRDNLIKNPSLTSLIGWNLYATKKGVYPDYHFYNDPNSKDNNVIEINGYGDPTKEDSYVHLKSDPVSVEGGKLLSFGSLHNCRINEGTNQQPTASIKLSILDNNRSEIGFTFIFYIPDTDDNLHLRQRSIVLPENASFVRLDFTIVGPGTFKVSEPQINYGPSLNAKVDSEVIRDIKNGDLLADNPVADWQPGWYTGRLEYAADESVFLTNTSSSDIQLQSEYVPVLPGETFDVQALIKTSGHVYLRFYQFDQSLNRLSSIDIDATQSDDYELQYFRSLTASSGTAYVAIAFAVGAGSSYNLKKVKLVKASSSDGGSSTNTSTNSLLIPKFLITDDLSNLSDNWKKSSFTYEENGRSIKGFLQIGIQGYSSREWRKKNYKVKLYEDADCTKKLKIAFKPSWVPDSRFNLKANFIDATEARNLVNAKLLATATAVTTIANETTRKGLSKSTQLGQMAGFPIELYINGTYAGLYTLNTKKDEKSFGMDDKNQAHEALEINGQDDLFSKGQTIDQKLFATIIQDQPNADVKAGFDRLVNFLNDATDEDIKAHLQDYIDIKSAMNTWLFGIMSQETDMWGRSVLLLTYDSGQHWFVTGYDFDSTWGLSWDGKSLDSNAEWFAFENFDSKMHKTGYWHNKLWTRIYDNFKPDLKKQYQYLRSNVWSTQALIDAYRAYIDAIPASTYEKDHKQYPDIPSLSTNNFAQIQGKIIERCTNMDAWIDKLA